MIPTLLEARDLEAQLADALRLLSRFEFLRRGATTALPGEPEDAFACPVCGWPKGGHDGPGKIKGNRENTHEQGCSMYAVLHGNEAPRIAKQSVPETHPLAVTIAERERAAMAGCERHRGDPHPLCLPCMEAEQDA